jgi:N-formylglutamate amidohydrolase
MIVIHIPHSSTVIPADAREQFVLGDAELADAVLHMTDWFVDKLFALPAAEAVTVAYPVSRPVCDPERFEDDEKEPMAARGMGVVRHAAADAVPALLARRHPRPPSRVPLPSWKSRWAARRLTDCGAAVG